jgi:hypothetical protein
MSLRRTSVSRHSSSQIRLSPLRSVLWKMLPLLGLIAAPLTLLLDILMMLALLLPQLERVVKSLVPLRLIRGPPLRW